MRPSGRVIVMSPSEVTKRTSVMPGPGDSSRENGWPSRLVSHAASRSAVGFRGSADTEPPLISPCGWSSVAASRERQAVALVQLRSVSPGR